LLVYTNSSIVFQFRLRTSARRELSISLKGALPMSIKIPAALAIAAILLTPSSLIFAQAAPAQSGADSQSTSAAASAEAAKMVPATASFIANVDSQKLPAGAKVQVKLQGKVRLENGPELPSGTVLVGQVVDDHSQSGKAQLALRFTEADLKNGQTVPIQATIINVYKESNEIAAGQYNVAGSPLGWDKQTLGVNQSDAIPGVDLHSSIGSSNSGVFVSTKKDDIKFNPSVELELAIAPRGAASGQSASGE
jgi:hypothetical protein